MKTQSTINKTSSSNMLNKMTLIRNVKRLRAPHQLLIKTHFSYTHKTKMNELFKYFTFRGWLVVGAVILLLIIILLL